MRARQRYAFGLSGFADNIVGTSIAVHLFRYYTDVVGLAPLLVSAGLAVALVWNAFSDFFMGRISDRTTWRAGRRRPYILLGAIPVGLAFVALHTPPPGLSQAQLAAYFTVMLLALFSSKTLVQVPILALMPELSRDSHERTLLAAAREQLGNVGDLVGLLLPIVMLLLAGADAPNASPLLAKTAFQHSAMAIGVLASLALLVTYAGTHEDRNVPQPQATPARELFAALRANQPFRALMSAAALGALALSFVQSMILYVLEHVMHEHDPKVHLGAFVLNAVAAIASYPLWTRVVARLGKATSFRLGLGLSSLAFSSIFFVGPNDYVALAFVMIFSGVSNVGFWMLLHALNAEVTDYDAKLYGQRREGLFAGFAALVKKLAIAGASASVGVGLWGIGYQEQVAPGAAVVFRLQLLFALPTTMLAFAALWCFGNYRFSQANSDNVSLRVSVA